MAVYLQASLILSSTLYRYDIISYGIGGGKEQRKISDEVSNNGPDKNQVAIAP